MIRRTARSELLTKRLSWGLCSVKAAGLGGTGAPARGETFLGFLANKGKAWWVYLILIISLTEEFLVLYGPETAETNGLRVVFGLGIIGFIPGYSSQRAIFPANDLPVLERILLSIFLSIVVSTSLGIVLGFLLAFSASSNTALLNLYTFAATLVAAHRTYLANKAQFNTDR